MTLFNSPLFVGFDHFERLVDRAAKVANEGYPPYNIEQMEGNNLRITLAVAGFCAEDLDVFIEDNQLAIQGSHGESENRVYLYRGIATRQFRRTFILAEGIEVIGAVFENGLLNVDLIRPKIETRAQRVPIRTSVAPLPSPRLLKNTPLEEKRVPCSSLPGKDSEED
ncbi:MAG: Hsp20 family protein [Holosporales bacterium]|jgi:HSP20 family molecular chaperone IbpA|nr:Hsp20 family protein [Holosporales bacterium]